MRPRRVPVTVLLVLLAPLAVPSATAHHAWPAGRAGPVTLGGVPSSPGSPDSCAPLTLAQIDTTAGTTAYQVPFDGVVTRWRHRAQDAFGAPGHVDMRLVLFSRDDTGTLTVRARSSARRLVAGGLNSFPARVEAVAGDLLGLSFTGAPTECDFDAGHADDALVFAFNYSTEPAPGDHFSGDIVPGFRGNIAAVVEPDVDADGYGDTSQDQCPAQPTGGQACDRTAPGTWFTRKPPARTRSHRAWFRFESSETPSTFRCRVDGGPFRACRTPAIRMVSRGPHVFEVAAVDEWANRDRSAAVARWRVTG